MTVTWITQFECDSKDCRESVPMTPDGYLLKGWTFERGYPVKHYCEKCSAVAKVQKLVNGVPK